MNRLFRGPACVERVNNDILPFVEGVMSWVYKAQSLWKSERNNLSIDLTVALTIKKLFVVTLVMGVRARPHGFVLDPGWTS